MKNDVLREVVGAMMSGTPIDWVSAESNAADESVRRVLRELKVIVEIAEVHGNPSLSSGRSGADRGAEIVNSVRRRDATEVASTLHTLRTWSALRILEKVGEGAFGEVYRAWDARLDREVALKLLRRAGFAGPRATSATVDEGRMLAQVRHPNVVTVHGADRSAGRVGLWMEFIHGCTLEQILRERGPFEVREATLVGLDLCHALSAVHDAGLLHRDIKAHNVMREDGGRIVLMDFGTGLDRADDRDHTAHGLAGTPFYMAPEILDGHEASAQSDIYSLGVLLFRLVTASYPVQGRSVQEVRDAHARRARTSLRDARPDLPENFVQIVERAIDPQPEDRYQSVTAVAADLVALSSASRRGALPSALGIAAALLVVVGLAWEIRGRLVGSLRTPSALLAGVVGLNDANASPFKRPVIVVLPFKNLSAEPDSDYFVDGLTDEVIRNLAVIDGLTVRSSASSFTFKNKPRNMREVGERLHANLVLDASVLRAGTQLRINVQLVRAADDVPLWSKRYDRELTDIFVIQDEISRAIVNNLRLTLGRGQRRYDTNPEAYELYLKGSALVSRRGLANLEKAAEVFQQVLVKEPAFAPAHAGLANAYALMLGLPGNPSNPIPVETAQPIIRAAAVKALDLDPLLADAYAAMGWVLSGEFDWAGAEKAFQRAIGLNPSLTQTYTSYSLSTLRPLGKHDEALRLLRVALENDPLSLDVQRQIGQVHAEAGRYEEAIDTFQHVRTIDPDLPFADEFLARALALNGRPADALPMFERSGQLLGRPKRSPRIALAYVLLGRRGEAEKLAVEHEDGLPSSLAVIHAALGDRDRAFEALERMAVVEPQRVPRLLMQPEMAGLRDDPRWAPFRRRFNLP